MTTKPKTAAPKKPATRAKDQTPPSTQVPVTAEEVLSAATANAQEVTKRFAALESDLSQVKMTARVLRGEVDAAVSRIQCLERQRAEQIADARWSPMGRAKVLRQEVRVAVERAMGPRPPASSAAGPLSASIAAAIGVGASLVGLSAMLYGGLLGRK